ncbi:hypothetical protein B9479_003069 [Cryptococcus floricola]|uniref:Uncharacterized protein n=1 Tax=Cryptococcus floricola TaxID=2591691 RepID=A0A5D3AY32_9TREE|nr:hypothetical protein B9479_003069 [Cryptococcus floricola]
MPQVDANSQVAESDSRVAFTVSSAANADGSSFRPSVAYTSTGHGRASSTIFGENVKNKANALIETPWAAHVYEKSSAAESNRAFVNTVAEHAQAEENDLGFTAKWSIASVNQ